MIRIRPLFVVVALMFSALPVLAQTNKSNTSTVGVWKLDTAKSTFGAEPGPKAVTLTILKDTPEWISWGADMVGAKGESVSYSWNGPKDGSLQPLKDAKGQILAQESMKLDKDGALLRHGVSFDGRAVLSEDGNTITDVVTYKTKDGKTSQETMVYRRVAGAK